MKHLLARAVRGVLHPLGLEITRVASPDSIAGAGKYPLDFSREQIAICEMVRPFTMTSPERITALCDAVCYLHQQGTSGAFVECGTWRGGSMMAVAQTLNNLGEQSRQLYLFDTFEGMSPPGAKDMRHDGIAAQELLSDADKTRPDSIWCVAALEEVKSNLASTGYDMNNVHFIKGRIEETVPEHAPASIALLRLDTDWYESTRHEMEHLFPRLVSGGVLILYDYGFWQGARRAVDEYLVEQGMHLLLNRIDETGRIAIKT